MKKYPLRSKINKMDPTRNAPYSNNIYRACRKYFQGIDETTDKKN